MSEPAEAPSPLSGLRVLDLSQEIAGPYAVRLLVDGGATAVKVEGPRGDPLRRWSATGDDRSPSGALFEFLNSGRRSVQLDLDDARDRVVLAKLARDVDLIVEGWRGPFLADAGITLQDLQRENSPLCLVSISPFGRAGPWRHRAANEFTVQAWSGSIASRGPEGKPPLSAGGRLGEWLSGAFAAAGALLALRHARVTGRGAAVDLSLLECCALTLSTVGYPSVQHSFGIRHSGGRHVDLPSIHPARDGWVGVCVVTGQQWLDFLVMIDRSDLMADRELATWAGRTSRSVEVRKFVESWTRVRSVAEILELADLFRVPAAPVGDGRSLPTFDHLIQRESFCWNEATQFLQPRPPFRSSASPFRRAIDRAPALGEHNAKVREELNAVVAPRTPTAPADCTTSSGPLAGLRVLDLTAFWAGPVATQLLAVMGADVVKVEAPSRPDPMRTYSPRPMSDPAWLETSPTFSAANLGKRAIALDMSQPAGRAVVDRLVAWADVVVENFTPRVIANLDLEYDALRQVNPRLIMLRMPAFGLDGPWRERGGFAPNVEQLSGLAWVTGHADGPPLVPGGACDPISGVHAVVALLAALDHRDRTGGGQLVEVPMVEVALNLAAEQVIEWSRHQILLARQGNRSPGAAPQGVYACVDQGSDLALAIETDEQWRALRTVMGGPAWAAVPTLDHVTGRHAAHDIIDREIGAWCASLDVDTIVESLASAGVPAAVVCGGARLGENPQLRDRGFFESVDHPMAGTHFYPGYPFRVGSWPERFYERPAPMFGEHTRAVLEFDLGLSREEIDDLARQGVVVTGD